MTDENLATIDPDELGTAPPFSDLFPMSPAILAKVERSMKSIGYDNSKPINVWRDRNLVVDGYTRRRAAINQGIDVLVYLHDFADEREALEYSISCQKDRRNLTEAEIVRCVLVLDNSMKKGGDRRSGEFKASVDALKNGMTKTAEKTAVLVGTNPAKVERTRRLDREAPDLIEDVLQGKRKVNGAYNELLKRKGKDPFERPNGRVKLSPGNGRDGKPKLVVPLAQLPVSPDVPPPSNVPPDQSLSLAIREKIGNPRILDIDVKVYEFLQPRLATLKRDVEAMLGPISSAQRGPLHQAFYDFLSFSMPSSWTLCPKCDGQGITCVRCNTCGYKIPKV